MGNKVKNKAEKIANAILLGLFVGVSFTSSLSLLNFIDMTDQAESIVGYIIGGFGVIVFSYIVWKSVDNK